MAEQLQIDISILPGILGQLQGVLAHINGLTGGTVAFDRVMATSAANATKGWSNVAGSVRAAEGATDAAMRGMVGDLLEPLQRARELEQKLADLGNRVRTTRSISEMQKLRTEIRGVQAELDKVNAGGMESRVAAPTSRLRSMFSSMAAPLAGAFAVSGVMAFGNSVVQAAAGAQSYGTALEVMLQNKQAADAMVADVKTFAATTPFELPQVQAASQQMLAFGFGSQEVIPQLRTLGNVASALNQPIGDIAYLFGTARVQGRLYTNDLMQFMNRGIPILGELSKVMGVSESQVKKLTEEGKVGFAQLQAAMNNLGAAGGRFDGLMDRQSQTIGGTLSNLSDMWGQFKADLGMSMAPLIQRTIGALQAAIGHLRDAFAWVQANGPLVKGVLVGVAIGVGLYTAALVTNNIATFITTLRSGGLVAALGLQATVTNVVSAATSIWTGVQWLLNAALTANPIGVVVMAIAALVAGIVWCWEECEGFRMFLYSLWGSISETFGAIWDIGVRVFGGLSDIVGGFVKTVKAAFTFDKALLQEGMLQQAKGMTTLLNGIVDAPGQIANRAVMGAVGGAIEGKKSFAKDQAEKQAEEAVLKGIAPPSAPGTATALTAQGATAGAATGNNLGAGNLLGGTGTTGDAKGGVTVGGSAGGGGDRSIVMNVTMHNRFDLGKAGSVDIMAVVDEVLAKLTGKLNDAQFARG